MKKVYLPPMVHTIHMDMVESCLQATSSTRPNTGNIPVVDVDVDGDSNRRDMWTWEDYPSLF